MAMGQRTGHLAATDDELVIVAPLLDMAGDW